MQYAVSVAGRTDALASNPLDVAASTLRSRVISPASSQERTRHTIGASQKWTSDKTRNREETGAIGEEGKHRRDDLPGLQGVRDRELAEQRGVRLLQLFDLAQLLVSTLKGQMIDRFVMAVDKGNCKLNDMVEAVAKAFSNGQTKHVTPDQALTIPWVSENLIDSVKYQVEEFTGMKIGKIDIFVEGVRVID